jgi:acyl-CoA thioester hydrolase
MRVYYEDTDAGGIVYHANWLRYFERARTDWLRALGATHRRLAADDGVLLVVRDLAIDYRLPARLDDELRVQVHVIGLRPARLRLRQQAFLVDGTEPLVRAELTVAAVAVHSQRAAGLPRWLLPRISPAVEPSGPPSPAAEPSP